MQLIPYLSFNGNCEEAFRTYERCLHGKIDFSMTYGQSPMAGHYPAEWAGKILHATLSASGVQLQASDTPPGDFQTMQGMSVHLAVATASEAERIFNELAEGATISMPIQETFWAPRFGMLTDRFGTPWMISCHTPGSNGAQK